MVTRMTHVIHRLACRRLFLQSGAQQGSSGFRVVISRSSSRSIGTASSKLFRFESYPTASFNRTASYSSTRITFASLAEQVQKVSSAPKPPLDVGKQLWEFYLSTGRGANALFEVLDYKEEGFIEPEYLMDFVMDVLKIDGEQIDPNEAFPYAWGRLTARAEKGEVLTNRDLKKWLVAATKMSADSKNSRILEYFKSHSMTGEQYISDAEEEDVYTWNEETMSQSLRRMQVSCCLLV